MSANVQKITSGNWQCILRDHMYKVKCFEKLKFFDDRKGGSVTFAGDNIIISGTTEKYVKESRKWIEDKLSKIISIYCPINPDLGTFLTKDQVRQYIDDFLGIDKKPVTWGVDVIMSEDNLVIFAFVTNKEIKDIQKSIFSCVAESTVTMDESGAPWFQELLKNGGDKCFTTINSKGGFTVYITKDLNEKYLLPNLKPVKNTPGSNASGRKSKSPAPSPPTNSHNSKESRDTTNNQTSGPTGSKPADPSNPSDIGQTTGPTVTESKSADPSNQPDNVQTKGPIISLPAPQSSQSDKSQTTGPTGPRSASSPSQADNSGNAKPTGPRSASPSSPADNNKTTGATGLSQDSSPGHHTSMMAGSSGLISQIVKPDKDNGDQYVTVWKMKKVTQSYMEKHLSKQMADISNRWKVNLKRVSDGISLRGQRANVESATKDLNTMFNNLVYKQEEIMASKPCVPKEMTEEWKQLKDKVPCMVEVKGSKSPSLKSGWICKDGPMINILYMEGRMDYSMVDILVCPVSKKLKPIGHATCLIGSDQTSFSCKGERKPQVGDVLYYDDHDHLFCHQLVLHVVDKKKLDISGNQIKQLAEQILSNLVQNGFRSVGFSLRYSDELDWYDFSCKLVQWLVTAGMSLKYPVTVFCFGKGTDFEQLDDFLVNQLELQKTLNLVVIEEDLEKVCQKSAIKVEVLEGSIVDYDKVDVMVNSVRNTLELKHGIVSNLLLKKGGEVIQKECKANYPEGIDYGDIAETSAGKLKFKKIFHVAVYPRFMTEGNMSAKILKTLMIKCLKEAEKRKFTSISFPALGTGKLDYPPLLVAKTMQEAVHEFGLTQPKYLQRVVFVLYNDKELIKLFKDVEEWIRLRRNSELQWDLPAKHVMYTVPDMKSRIIITDRDYYPSMAYKELRVISGKTPSKDLERKWDSSDGCYVTPLPPVSKDGGVKANMMDLVTIMQSQKIHVADLFLDTSKLPAQRQIDVLVGELCSHETGIRMRNNKLPNNKQPETNYVNLVRVFLPSDEYKSVADYYDEKVFTAGNGKKWYFTEVKSFPFSVEVVGQKGKKIEDVFQRVVQDVSSLEATTKLTWQVNEKEKEKAKKIVAGFRKDNYNIDFIEDTDCVICEGTAKQLDAVSKKLDKFIDHNVNIAMSEDDFAVLLNLTNDDHWRASLSSKPEYDKGRAIFRIAQAEDVSSIRACIESKLNVIHQLSTVEVVPPGPFEDKFDAVKALVESLDSNGGVYCLMSYDRKKILIRSENYQILQQAKHVAETELGMIQATGRRNRVIATDEYSRGPAKNQGVSQDSSAKQGKLFKTHEGIQVLVYSSGINSLQVDTLVNAANKDLQHGGGIAYHISNGAGYKLDKECDDYIRSHGSLRVGTCMSTTAGNLPYHCIIHAVGPMWHSYPHNKKQQCLDDLKQTVLSAIMAADIMKLRSIAIPSISSGIFGVPKELCTDQYYEAVVQFSRNNLQTSIREIHFIDKDRAMCTLIQKTFEKRFGQSGQHI